MAALFSSNHQVPVDTTITLEELDRDPAAVYRRLRHETPIVRIAALNRIILTKADDAHLAKTDTHHFHSSDNKTPMQRAFGGHTLMRKDGEKHLTERHAMAESFKIKYINGIWRDRFEQLANMVVSGLPSGGICDLRTHLAEPMASLYVKQILGVDPESDEQLFNWANALIAGAMNSNFDPAPFAISDLANEEMNACFDKMILRHQQNPNPSVLSMMANSSNMLPFSQIRTNMKICIGGAVVESRDAILTTLHGLLQNSDQLHYCIETNRWDLACEEGLRWVAPIQASARIVKENLMLRGVVLPAGETILVAQGSANHDEDYWHDPHLFNVNRPQVPNQTFGLGPHRCMGGDIYRLVAQIVMKHLFDRFPNMSSVYEHKVEFRGFLFRGPTTLPVLLA